MTMASGGASSVPIEPSPRILQMLGHVNFQGWQCLAELVDNSIDALLSEALAGDKRVDIRLPLPSELEAGRGMVEVRDNGSGMSIEQMQNAVRAGYSGNDPISKLGLFGMGFNVATARIGQVTEILSHRPEDSAWHGIRIDVDHMIKNRTWNAPLISEPLADSDGPSGTVVRISKVPRQGVVRSMIYGRGKSAVLRKLSRIYHVAMQRHGLQISINETPLAPWRLCLWNASRSVPTQAWGPVPAQFPVDIKLAPLPYCTNCWEWGATDDQQVCVLCGGPMIVRERRIRGVLGVQRSFSVAWGEAELAHYGIDLIRNGRVIEEFDKDLFDWIDPADPSHREVDYPVDATYLGGRIIGELELDFVPLRSYHKDSFEKADPAWNDVRAALRGAEAPLRPDVARRKGYERPDTILARLFDGYRKTSPAGERYLVTGKPPGRRKSAREVMHTSPELTEWIDGFEAGEPEYETDQKWWEAVRWAEADDEPPAEEPEVKSVFDMDDDSDIDEPSEEAGEEPTDESDAESQLQTTPDASLTVIVSTDGIVRNAPVSLEVRAARVVRGALPGGHSVLVDPRGPEIHFTWDPSHPDFALGLARPVDCLISELAVQLLYRAQVTQREYPISVIQREIARRTFPQRDPGIAAAAERAAELLGGMRKFLVQRLAEGVGAPTNLDPLDLAELERAAAASGVAKATLPDLIAGGEFLTYMSTRFLAKSALLWPQLLMSDDEGYYAVDYEGYATEELRAELRESLYANLIDVVWLVEQRANIGSKLSDLSRIQFQKSLSALELLELRRIG